MAERFRALLLLLLCGIPMSAQTHRETVTVEVVDVPVYVTRRSEPVLGLTRDDFELFVDGERTAIDYFDVIGDAPVAGPSGTRAGMRERRLFVLLFDLAFTRSYLARRAQLGAARLIDDAEPLDSFAIATFAPAAGLRYTLPFTSDKAAVKRAILDLSAAETYDPLRLVARPLTRADLIPNEPVDPNEEPAADWTEARSHDVTSDPAKEAQITPKGAQGAERASGGSAVKGTLIGLNALATNLARIEGQKHVVLISEGFDITVLNESHAMVEGSPGLYMMMELEKIFRSFRAAGVFLHTLDPGGLREIKQSVGSPALRILASGTGGQAVDDRNDLHLALSDLKSSFHHGYILGFRPAGAQEGEKQIVVKVKQGGVRVTHRRGFALDGGTRTLNGLYLADVVLNDVPQTGLIPVMEIERGQVRARLPMKQIAAQLGGEGDAELLVYLFDAQGQPVDFRRRRIDVTANDVEVVDLQMGLRPGTYALKTLMRVGDSLGFTRANLKVGAPAKPRRQ